MSMQLTVANIITQSQYLGRSLTQEDASLLADYLGLLVKWNQRMNLVGPATWERILEILIQDSWHLADVLFDQNIAPEHSLDLGAGAGLPGIPLRIWWPRGEYLLVEPRQKRALFMEQAIMHMGLSNTMVFQGRMENLPPEKRQAGLIISRAFKPWRALLSEATNYLMPQGHIVVMTNDPEPKDVLDGYTLELIREYTVAQKKRYFWLFILGRKSFS